MNCKITATPDFARELKHLAKRYLSIKEDYKTFLENLRDNPLMGTELGRHLRKVRFPIASKGKGKSGGARVITFNYIVDTECQRIVLVKMYDKSEISNISDAEIMHAFETL